jgi:hypothetical protein
VSKVGELQSKGEQKMGTPKARHEENTVVYQTRREAPSSLLQPNALAERPPDFSGGKI